MSHGFHLVPAHSVETLAEAFAVQIARRENPLRPETVLVMNHAQGVWLRRFLARRLGVCANIRFLSPEKFLENLVAAETSVFSRGALAWRIFEKLQKMRAPDAGTPREFSFAENGESDAGCRRLAVRLSDLFWRYQSFRPQMIRDWTDDAPEPARADADFLREYRRQKNLWRAIVPATETPPAVAWLNLLETENFPAEIPPRIFAFAPSALPRIHCELLEKLAESTEVFLYFHNLSSDLWTESPDAKKRLRERVRAAAKTRKTPEISRGNAEENFADSAACELLAAWGKAARPLTQKLIDDGFLDADSNLDAAPEATCLLRALQRDIRENAPAPTRFVPAENDRSLKISVAPNPLREMEILRDELTARFAENPKLAPGDVLIMLADIETYAPFVRAVFENSGFPFSLADQDETPPATKIFFEILRVARGEIRLDEVLALLDSPAIQNALALDGNDVSALRETLADAGIRWGADADFRRERIFGNEKPSPEAESFAERNSWAFGLRRLALGYALGAEENDAPETFGTLHILPAAELTEHAPETVGKVAKLVRMLTELNHAFASREKRTVPAWRAFLQNRIIDEFLDAENDGADDVRKILAETENDARIGALSPGNPTECTLEIFVDAAETQISGGARRGGSGMLRGKITFCEMRPMRNIPAKILGIAGLNDGAFPHAGTRDCADLTFFPAKNFPAGTTLWDRSRRDDDCLLFLESLLAAKETLLLSYVGRAAQDGQPLPPCVPLAKLRDYLLKITAEEAADSVGTPSFETLHRLHGFSPEYFSDDAARSRKFFSFSRTHYATATNFRTASDAGFLADARPPNAREREALSEISAREFSDFFRSPAKFICKRRLAIADVHKRDLPESDDPAQLFSALDPSRFHRELVEKILSAASGGNAFGERFFEKNLENFKTRELLAGNSASLVRAGEFEKKLGEKIDDCDALFSEIPEKLFPVGPSEIPSALDFKIGVPAALSSVRIALNFPTLFRCADGELFLALFGKKNLDWRAASETFVNAQLLAAAFPQRDFRVAYFAYDEKSPGVITRESLAKSGISPQALADFYATGTENPPLIFEKTPKVSEKDSAEIFLGKTEKNWSDAATEEIFIFGENAPETLRKNILGVAFPFVRAVFSAFAEES